VLVIFDNDGVLVDSEEISNTVLAEMLTEHGLPTTLEESLRTYQGMMLADIATKAERQMDSSLPGDFLDRYLARRAAVFERDLKPVPGAADAVEKIRSAGIEICVASQGGANKIDRTLEICGLRPHFPDGSLFSAYDVARGKPHPDLFLHAAERMGSDPADCVVIEDSASGVQGARAAGMRVLGYAAEGGAGDALAAAGAAEVFASMTLVPGLIGVDSDSTP
jgi:HAD superfamily hydrolase (TIGR01509 family)